MPPAPLPLLESVLPPEPAALPCIMHRGVPSLERAMSPHPCQTNPRLAQTLIASSLVLSQLAVADIPTRQTARGRLWLSCGQARSRQPTFRACCASLSTRLRRAAPAPPTRFLLSVPIPAMGLPVQHRVRAKAPRSPRVRKLQVLVFLAPLGSTVAAALVPGSLARWPMDLTDGTAGMKYRHYSPRAPVHICDDEGQLAAAVRQHLDSSQGGGETAGRGAAGEVGSGGGRGVRVPWLGVMATRDVLEELAMRLQAERGAAGLDCCVLVECGDKRDDADGIARGLFGTPFRESESQS